VRRRSFLALVGAASLSVAAQAQQRKRLVGLITGFTEAEMAPIAAAFRARMRELGWIDGENVVIEVTVASGDYDKLRVQAGEFVKASADVIVAMGTPGLTATRVHTRTVPVVFTQVADPVGQKLIGSLARPGGNATGLTNFEFSFGGKWLELLRELDPRISHATLITNPANANTAQFVRAISAAGRAMNVAIEVASVHNAEEITRAIEMTSRSPGGSLVIFPDSLPILHRDLIVELAGRHGLPAVYPFRLFPEKGGLLSYGTDFKAVYRQAAEYTDKILKGVAPGDLPAEAPNKFELVLNLKTAKSLGLMIPQSLQVAADEVIE